MTLEKAINRISWRFKNTETFTTNEEDVEAVNLIIDWIYQKGNKNALEGANTKSKIILKTKINMRYRIKIKTFKNGRKEYTPQVKAFIGWFCTMWNGKTSITMYEELAEKRL